MEDRLTIPQIADHCEVTVSTIQRLFGELQLPFRRKVRKPTEAQMEFINRAEEHYENVLWEVVERARVFLVAETKKGQVREFAVMRNGKVLEAANERYAAHLTGGGATWNKRQNAIEKRRRFRARMAFLNRTIPPEDRERMLDSSEVVSHNPFADPDAVLHPVVGAPTPEYAIRDTEDPYDFVVESVYLQERLTKLYENSVRY